MIKKGEPAPEPKVKVKPASNTRKKTKPSLDKKKEEEVKPVYTCTACGKTYTDREKNFPYSFSPFFKANNSRLTICNACLDSITDQYQAILGTQDDAIRRMCLHLDMYLDERVLATSRKIDAHRSRIKQYIKLCNLSQTRGKTYDDFLEESASTLVEDAEAVDEVRKEGTNITKAAFERWGPGWEPQEYSTLERHYKLLTSQIIDWGTQEETIRTLCETHVLKDRARRKEDYDKYDKMANLYKKYYDAAGFKKATNDTDTTQPLGVLNMIVEGISPAEYYKDKHLFEDMNGIADYWQRFIVRPFRNLFTGNKDEDPEFSISNEEV